MKQAHKFWDGIADKYAADPVKDKSAYQSKLDQTAALLNPDSHVFEFGCGTGTTAIYHAPNVARIVATDISPRMIEIAKAKAAEAGVSSIDFQATDFEGYESAPASFDMVMAHSILHLVPDRHDAIQKAYSLLKPGGYFVSSTACLKDKMSYLHPIIWAGRLVGKVPPVTFLKGAKLIEDIRAAGFNIQDSKTYSKGLVTWVIAQKP